MSQTNNTTKAKGEYTHLSETERDLIEGWYNVEGKSQAEIVKLLGRSRSTISVSSKRTDHANQTGQWL